MFHRDIALVPREHAPRPDVPRAVTAAAVGEASLRAVRCQRADPRAVDFQVD